MKDVRYILLFLFLLAAFTIISVKTARPETELERVIHSVTPEAAPQARASLTPEGDYVIGTPTLAPDGHYVGGNPVLMPDGTYKGDGSNE